MSSSKAKGCQEEKDSFYISQVRRNCRGLILFSMTENLLIVRAVQKWNGLPPGSLDLQSGEVFTQAGFHVWRLL